MEVANASMYDGSTALPEAVMMACRSTGRSRAVVTRSVHPEYRQVHRTYARNQGLPIAEAPYNPQTGLLDLAALDALVDDSTAAVVVQNPNFYGCVEPVAEAAAIAHPKGALLIVVFTEAVSLGLLQPPVDADIVAGELQSFAISPSYGGPYVGVIAAKEKLIRQMPGRLVGQTTDSEGRRAFCLTLATREQHIRREKATSNICTNQALVALMATIFMSVYGKQGLRELAEQNLAKAHYLAARLEARGIRRRFSGPFFNEFVVDCAGRDPAVINRRLLDHRIIGGLELSDPPDCLLLCATEMTRREDIDRLVELW
jgi:glycine dehydrogenase subunit 1